MEHSPIRAELIKLRLSWFGWAIAISASAGLMYGLSAESAGGTPFGAVVGAIGMVALVLPLYALYKLSMAVEPKRSVAWAMVALQAVPIIGLVAVISLAMKAGRII